MFGKTHIFRKVFSNVQGTWLRRGIFYLALLLALGVGTAGQTAPAHAAPRADTRISYLVQVFKPKGSICVGHDYSVTVRLTKFNEVLLGGETDWRASIAQGLNGQKIDGSVENPDIGTLTPSSILTGWSLGEAGDAPGEALFSFHADKAGSTLLLFTIDIHDYDRDGPIYKIEKGGESIKVVNCNYKVNMNATDIDSGGGVTIWTTGNLEVKITDDNGELKGSGNFDFVSGFVGPPCTIQYSEFSNATTITGQVDDNDQLTLQFAFEPGQITSNVSCPGGGGSATHQIDLTNLGIASATFSASGGTRMFRVTYAGSDMAPGTMIINVQPVSEDEGGLSS